MPKSGGWYDQNQNKVAEDAQERERIKKINEEIAEIATQLEPLYERFLEKAREMGLDLNSTNISQEKARIVLAQFYQDNLGLIRRIKETCNKYLNNRNLRDKGIGLLASEDAQFISNVSARIEYIIGVVAMEGGETKTEDDKSRGKGLFDRLFRGK